MSENKFEEEIKEHNEQVKEAIRSTYTKEKFLGQDVVVFKDLSTQDGYSYSEYVFDKLDSELRETVSMLIYNLKRKARKDDEMFVEEIDM